MGLLDGLKPELIDGLEMILADEHREEIFNLSKKISYTNNLNIRKQDLSGLLPELFERGSIAPIFAAVYLANAEYFNRKLDISKEEVVLEFPEEAVRATYSSRIDRYGHVIKIPRSYFQSWYLLLSAMDSESRHAVHSNVLYSQNLPPSNLAVRSYLVITEIIDLGIVYSGELMSWPHFDPLINELSMETEKGEIYGHNGARYFCKHLLSPDKAERKKQMNWLIRMKLRRKFSNDQAVSLTEKFIKIADIIEKDQPLLNPYDLNLDLLVDFYAGRSNYFSAWPVVQEINKTRKFLLDNCPFTYPSYLNPDLADVVNVDGNLISSFATCLDYAALKLKYTEPKELAREVGL